MTSSYKFKRIWLLTSFRAWLRDTGWPSKGAAVKTQSWVKWTPSFPLISVRSEAVRDALSRQRGELW